MGRGASSQPGVGADCRGDAFDELAAKVELVDFLHAHYGCEFFAAQADDDETFVTFSCQHEPAGVRQALSVPCELGQPFVGSGPYRYCVWFISPDRERWPSSGELVRTRTRAASEVFAALVAELAHGDPDWDDLPAGIEHYSVQPL